MTESAVLQILVDASIRSLLVAAAVGAVLLVARARTGSVEHSAWTLVMVTMLLLPVLPKWLPAPPISLPPVSMSAPPAVSGDTIETRIARPGPSPRTSSAANPAPAVSRVTQERAPVATPAPARKSTAAAVLFIWLAGVAALLVRLIAGWWHAARLVARCPGQRGQVFESPLVSTPVAVGVWTPRILVPLSWHSWPDNLRNTVLIHERAHIRRCDTLVNLLAHVNRCIYWFNPLAWWLERRIALTAEQACDDAVIRASNEAQNYAGLLVEMASCVRARGGRIAWHGAGIMGRGALSARVDRILAGCAGTELSSSKRWTVIVLTLSLLVPGIACRQPVAALRESPELAAEFTRERERRLELEALENLDRAGLASLEAQVAKNPNDLALTAKLLYFYRDHGQKLMSWNDMVAARRPHLLRMIDKHPESEYTWWPIPQRLDPDGWAKARALWMAHLASPNVTPKVLGGAARFFGISEKPVAEEILLRAQKMDPGGPQPRVVERIYYPPWTSQLGQLYARAIVGSDDDTLGNVVRSVTLEEANGQFATVAKKKLADSRDPELLRAAGAYLTHNARIWNPKVGDQKIDLGFDHRALGESYLDRARELDPDSETTRRVETYRKRAAEHDRTYRLVTEKLGGWDAATPDQLASLPEADRIQLLPELAAYAIMGAEAVEHEGKGRDDADVRYAKARAFSEQALQLADKLGAGTDASRLRVSGHLAKGLVALRDGNRAQAVSHLKASTEGTDANDVAEDMLWSRLTNYLLAAGERETVAQFFDTVSRTTSGPQRFVDAAKAVRAGQMPDGYQRQMTQR
jgi:beta-lactamase regulating signal transducer with metallopeptidase domain